MHPDRFLDCSYIGGSQAACPVDQTQFADRCQLIRHCFILTTVEPDQCFAGEYSPNGARERYDLDTVEVLIGRIVADNNGWPLLANFAAD